jgi:hypothetical protein
LDTKYNLISHTKIATDLQAKFLVLEFREDFADKTSMKRQLASFISELYIYKTIVYLYGVQREIYKINAKTGGFEKETINLILDKLLYPTNVEKRLSIDESSFFNGTLHHYNRQSRNK